MTHWSSPPWVCRLTNAELIDELGTADDARQHRGEAPDLLRRMDVLADEIHRRELAGTLTDRDWKKPPNERLTIVCQDGHRINIEFV